MYFTASEQGAARYGENVIPVYLNIKNPYVKADGFNTVADQIASEFGIARDSFTGKDVSSILRQRGYDGVVMYDGNGEIVIANAFDSTQIKSATDNIGTFDGSNPDILYSSRTASDSEYLNLAQNPEENREALSRMVEQAAREAVLNYNLQDGQKNNAREGERFSIRKTQKMSWDEQIMGALYGKGSIARNDTLVAGQISTSLAQEGIEQLPLAIPRSVLTKASDGRDISHSIKKGKLAKLNVGIKNSPITIVNPARNAIVFITDIKQGGAPVLVAFDRNTLFDGDKVHKATSIHLQMNVQAMLENLPASATVYVKNRNELAAVGATDNLRGLAANVKLISDGIVAQPDADVKGILKSSRDTSEMTYAEILAEQAALRARQEQVKAKENAAMNNPELLSAMDSYTEMFSELRNLLW